MKKIIVSSSKTFQIPIILLILLLTYKTVNAQIITYAPNNAAAQALVSDILVGSGVTIVAGSTSYFGQLADSSGQVIGSQIGSFSGFSKTNLGIHHGIIMSTGNVMRANHPNTKMSEDNYFEYYCNCEAKNGDVACSNQTNPVCKNGDADLDAILGCSPSCTFDAVSLQFDFIPSSNPVNFRYVFASDEYPDYVCSTKNDAFAFLVTGPNPKGGNYTKQNIALVPGTNEPVSINTVNSGVCGKGYTSHNGTDLTNSMYYVNNTNGKSIVYNAFTTVLTAKLDVIPCQQYHIKIALADVRDDAFDSALFLEAESFIVSGPKITYHNLTPDTTAAFKKCGQAIITFTTFNKQGVQADSIINISFAGTAVYGTDYTTTNLPDPTKIIMPKGTSTYTFHINPLCTQPGTDLNVLFNVITCGITATYTVNIEDVPVITATKSPDITICSGASATISVTNVQGGIGGPYNYSWSSNPAGFTSEIPNPTVSPAVTTTYTVVIADDCGACLPNSFNIVVTVANPAVTITASGPTVFCIGDKVILNANPTNFVYYQWQSSGLNIPGETNTSYTATVVGDYTVVVTDINGCTATSNDITVTIVMPTAILTPEGPTIFCLGGSVILDANIIPGFTYQWMKDGNVIPGATYTSLTVDSSGTYSFINRRGAFCTATSDSESIIVDKIAHLRPYIYFDGATLISSIDNGNQWYFNNSIIPNATGKTLTPEKNGKYYDVIVDSIGCISDSSNIIIITNASVEELGSRNCELGIKCYPNPFNQNTVISYQLPETCFVNIKVFDILGNEVSSLVNKTICKGNNKVEFDATRFLPGIYYYRIYAGKQTATGKMVLIK